MLEFLKFLIWTLIRNNFFHLDNKIYRKNSAEIYRNGGRRVVEGWSKGGFRSDEGWSKGGRRVVEGGQRVVEGWSKGWMYNPLFFGVGPLLFNSTFFEHREQRRPWRTKSIIFFSN